jgi:hypothetical protein
MNPNSENHAFSVELNNKDNLKSLALSNSVNSKIVIEGLLGKLLSFSFIENAMLEIKGANGTFRIDLYPQDICKIQQAVAKV